MFKKIVTIGAACVALSSLSGCYASMAFLGGGAPIGFLYAGAQGHQSATANPIGAKTGESCAMSILGLITIGDASAASAAKSAGITKIAVVDSDNTNILGIYAKHCAVVTGD